MIELNTPPTAQAAKMQQLLAWLGDLIQQHGPGDYIVTIRADGSVLVKRPRDPLRFEMNDAKRT